MNLRVVLLSMLVAASAATAWYLSRDEQSIAATPAATLLDGLSEKADAIQYLKVENAANVVFEAKRKEGKWQAVHLDNSLSFPVDTKALSALIRRITQASVIEKKTENESLYSRLGVEELNADAAKSVLLTLDDGKQQWKFLVGNKSNSRRGHFIRHPDQQASYLIDKVIVLPHTTAEWLTDNILPASMDELIEARFWHPENEELLIARDDGTQDQWVASTLVEEKPQPIDPATLSYPGVLTQALDDIFAFNYLQTAPFSQSAWESQELAGKVDMRLNDDSRILVEVSRANELDQYQVHFDMPDNPSWVSDWVFTVSGYQGRAFLMSLDAITAANRQ